MVLNVPTFTITMQNAANTLFTSYYLLYLIIMQNNLQAQYTIFQGRYSPLALAKYNMT